MGSINRNLKTIKLNAFEIIELYTHRENQKYISHREIRTNKILKKIRFSFLFPISTNYTKGKISRVIHCYEQNDVLNPRTLPLESKPTQPVVAKKLWIPWPVRASENTRSKFWQVSRFFMRIILDLRSPIDMEGRPWISTESKFTELLNLNWIAMDETRRSIERNSDHFRVGEFQISGEKRFFLISESKLAVAVRVQFGNSR